MKTPFTQRLKAGFVAMFSTPATGQEISDIAVYLETQKNRYNPEIRKVLAEAADKLHAVAGALMIEERVQ
jgi:hypothetical protein